MGKALSLKIHAYDTVSDRMKMFSLCDLCGYCLEFAKLLMPLAMNVGTVAHLKILTI